jgi:hypothetical protein
MQTRLVVPVLLGTILISLSAFAAGMTPAEGTKTARSTAPNIAQWNPDRRCKMLDEQFQNELTSHESAGMSKLAQSRHDEGQRLCASGQKMEGAAMLEAALREIGAVPGT